MATPQSQPQNSLQLRRTIPERRVTGTAQPRLDGLLRATAELSCAGVSGSIADIEHRAEV